MTPPPVSMPCVLPVPGAGGRGGGLDLIGRAYSPLQKGSTYRSSSIFHVVVCGQFRREVRSDLGFVLHVFTLHTIRQKHVYGMKSGACLPGVCSIAAVINGLA